jgi:hypothetical protein
VEDVLMSAHARCCIVVACWWVVAAGMGALPAWGQDGTPASEELKRLNRYVGRWNGTVENVPQTSTSEMSWILQGTVLEQKYKYSDGSTGLILRGYEKETGQYFFTLMDSRGVTLLLSNGTWNEATKTFQFEGDHGAGQVTVRSTFQDDNTENWTITIVKTGGEVVELRGTNRRQSP